MRRMKSTTTQKTTTSKTTALTMTGNSSSSYGHAKTAAVADVLTKLMEDPTATTAAAAATTSVTANNKNRHRRRAVRCEPQQQQQLMSMSTTTTTSAQEEEEAEKEWQPPPPPPPHLSLLRRILRGVMTMMMMIIGNNGANHYCGCYCCRRRRRCPHVGRSSSSSLAVAVALVGLWSGVLLLIVVVVTVTVLWHSPLLLYGTRNHKANNRCPWVLKDCLLAYQGLQLNNGLPLHMQKHPSLLTEEQRKAVVLPAVKAIMGETSSSSKTQPNVCFVHVGKTAGTTVQCYLGFLEPDCFANRPVGGRPTTPIAPGRLPYVTTHKIHNDWNGCQPPQEFDYYLFVLRDPLARIQSWFTYERPPPATTTSTTTRAKPRSRTHDRIPFQARLFDDCHFHTLNELALYGLDLENAHGDYFDSFVHDLIPSDDEQLVLLRDSAHYQRPRGQNLCQHRAHMAIHGWVGYYVHNRYNYQYYLQQVVQYHSNVSIAVIRTEFLQRDWHSMEELVAGGRWQYGSNDTTRTNNGYNNITFARKNNASSKHHDDLFLSDVAVQRLCHALCDEIQTYKQLLRRAVNLAATDVALSLLDLAKSCPVEAAAETCRLDDSTTTPLRHPPPTNIPPLVLPTTHPTVGHDDGMNT